jgi:hypothetical protein
VLLLVIGTVAGALVPTLSATAANVTRSTTSHTVASQTGSHVIDEPFKVHEHFPLTKSSADSPSVPSGCSQSGDTVSCPYGYTGSAQYLTLPSGPTSFSVGLGGGGGGGDASGGSGGSGSLVSGTLPGSDGGTSLTIFVGGLGGESSQTDGGWPDGGTGGSGESNPGCGGGGSTSIVSGTSLLALAAGGGGCGGYGSGNNPSAGGAGGGSTGGGGSGGAGGCGGGGGGGGSQTAGGGGGGTSGNVFCVDKNGGGGGSAYTIGSSGVPSDAGNGGSVGGGDEGGGGGGGGGGYQGGGGGASAGDIDNSSGGGGGGGSDYTSSLSSPSDTQSGNGRSYGSATISWVIHPTSTSIDSSSATSANAGQDATLVADVSTTDSSGYVPTGTVDFYDSNNNLLCSGTLNQQSPDQASCTYQTTTNETITYDAQYQGDGASSSSTSGTQDLVVSPDSTTTSDVSSSVSSVTSLTLSSTVTPQGYSPVGLTGTVTFYYGTGSTQPSSVTSTACAAGIPSGQTAGQPFTASCTFDVTPGTEYWLQASYSGDSADAVNSGSQSPDIVSTTASQASTGTTLNFTSTTLTYGNTDTVSATVTGIPSTDSSPGQLEYEISDGSTTPVAIDCGGGSNPVDVSSNGSAASCSFTPSTSENNVIGVYLGDAQTTGSQSGTTVITVNDATSSVSLSVSPSTGGNSNTYVGVPITATAVVTNSSSSGIPPDGVVAFSEDGSPVASCTDIGSSSTDGTAETSTYECTSMATPSDLSTHNFSVTYCPTSSGSATCDNWVTSTDTATYTAQPDPTSVTLTGPGSATGGRPITVHATVGDTSGDAALTGTLTFNQNGSGITGCVDLTLTSDAASCNFTPTAGHTDNITASYNVSSGSLTQASLSNILQIGVNGVPTKTSITVSTQAGAVAEGGTIAYGVPVTITAAVTAGTTNVTSGTVSFTIDDNPIKVGGTTVCGSVAFSHGVASCIVSSIALGTHTIVASFTSSSRSYDSGSSPSTDNSWTIGKDSTSTTLTVGADTTGLGDIALTAAVANTSANSTTAPIGTVSFAVVGGSTISTCTSVSVVSGSNGTTATCDIPEPTSTTRYTATYTPTADSGLAGSTAPNATFSPGATCSTTFNTLWLDAGKKIAFGVGPLGTSTDAVSVTAHSETGLCNPVDTLPVSGASLSLFGSTLASTGLSGYIADGSNGSDPQLCFTAGSLALPSGWRLGAISLSATADLCIAITAAGSTNTLGLPVTGQLTVQDIPVPFGNPDPSISYELVLKITGSSSPELTIALEPTATPAAAPYLDATATVSISGSTVAATGTVMIGNLPFGPLTAPFTVSAGSAGKFAGSIGPVVIATTPYSPVPGLSLQNISVTLSSTNGLSFSGSATFGASSQPVTMNVSGGYSSGTFSLSITSSKVTWTPFSSLTISTTFSGSVTITTAGAVTFDVEAGTPPSGSTIPVPIVAWNPISGLAVDMYCVALAYGVTPTCNGSNSLSPGDPQLTLIGSVTVGSGSHNVTVGIDGALDLSTGDVDLSLDTSFGSPTVTVVSGLTVTLQSLTVSGSIGAGLTVDATASASIPQLSSSPITVTITNAGGPLVVAVEDVSLSNLGVPLTGFFAYASGDVASFDAGSPFGTVALGTGFNVFVDYTPSTAVADALSQVGFNVGDTVEFTATWDPGSSPTITATLAAPSGFPFFSLPDGGGITGATLSWASDELSISVEGTIPVPNSSAADITLSITLDTSTGDISGNATVTGLTIWNQPVTNFTGSFSWSSKNGFSGTITADIPGPFTPFSGVPVQFSNIDLSIGTGGLSLSGDMAVGPSSNQLANISISGSITDLDDWSLTLTVAASTWNPAPDVSISATLNGSITDAKGKISFDLTASGSNNQPLFSFTVSGVTVNVDSVEFGNGTPPSTCTVATAGDLFLSVDGSVAFTFGGKVSSATAGGCFDITNKSLELTASLPGLSIPTTNTAISLSAPTVTFTESGGKVTADVQLSLSVNMPSGGTLSTTVTLSVLGDGGFVVGAAVDLSQWLGSSAASAFVYYSSEAVTSFDTGSALGTLSLSQGINFGLQIQLSGQAVTDLNDILGLDLAPNAELVATVNLDFASDTYTFSITLSLGTGRQGIQLFCNGGTGSDCAGGTSLVLNSGSFFVELSPSVQEFGIQVNATLNVAPPSGSDTGSTVPMVGQFTIGSNGFNFSLSIGNCSDVSDAWNNAFGATGLTVLCASLGGGITPELVPNIELAGTITGLPSSVATAIGYNPNDVSPGPPICFAFQIDPFLLSLQIGTPPAGTLPSCTSATTGAPPGTVALEPFEAYGEGSLLEVDYAGLYFAPQGATVGGVTYPAGIGLGFSGSIEGVNIDVIADIGFSPPSLYFTAHADQFTIGGDGGLQIGPITITLCVNNSTYCSSGFNFTFDGSAELGPGTVTIIPSTLEVGGYISATVDVTISTSGVSAYLAGDLEVTIYNYESTETCYWDGWAPYPCDWEWNTTTLGPYSNSFTFDASSSGIRLGGDGYSITFDFNGSISVSGSAMRRAEEDAARARPPTTLSVKSQPTVGSWAATGSMGVGQGFASVATLPGGDVLVAGGDGPSVAPITTAEIYDPATRTWTTAKPMPVARVGAVTAALPDGSVLVAGGIGVDGKPLASADIYDPSSGKWSAAASMPFAAAFSSTADIGDGDVLVAGGSGAGHVALSSAAIYDSATGQWTATGSMHKARVFGALAVLADGDVLAAGGYNGKELAGAEVFDPSTGVWTKVAAMPAARSGVSAVTLNDGAVLVFGDDNNGFIYNPAKNTWTQTGGSSAPFSLVSLVKLPDGSVLVLGGITQHGTVSVAEVYDPTTGKWSSAGTTSQARIGSAAVVLSNGQVLVAGGNRMGLTGLKSQVTSFATDTSAELFSLVPTRVPPFGTPPPRSTPPPGSTPHPGSTVPSTSTGEPWASFAYWLVVGLGGGLGLAAFEVSRRRRRRFSD